MSIELDTIRDLGVPAVVGSVVGALIAHYSAKARGQEGHTRAKELLVVQDERRAARQALTAVRAIKNRINSGQRIAFGELHNEWADGVVGSTPLRLCQPSRTSSGRPRAAS
jgi:hypothetical protein